MAKQISVNLAFTADTNQARQQLNQLKNDLVNLTTSTTALTGGKNLGITTELSKASAQAAQLKIQLESATNAVTGRLDLTKFNQSLKQSGMSVEQYKNALTQLGPAGRQAFQGLATAVSQAEVPLFRVNAVLNKMGQTLKNTVRWQISASLITGFIGAIQKAYNYAEDLNRSLNDIRIVTGKTMEEMDAFAKKANRTAKELSASTLDYTKASLIYYQQGIKSQQEIEARTNATIKLANVTGESAEQVSEWMTAIWNNFDNGSRSLENYADVLAKLGAETASSADEIATGMEKFAAIGETVGLSYNNAAAALATVTATTRQSADVVGTSFKTLFSRMEQLKLGETLDDGTTLGQYSEALASVGVNIKDANGQLKDMDLIIDETGRKWATLGRDQQVALAQQVAGIRQYTQFMALMDNYDYYQQLTESANNATGALQEQQKIYEESWQAASDRITASLEKIYTTLLDDDFFIGITNLLANGVDLVGALVDGLGGVGGLLTTILVIATKLYAGPIANSFDSLRATVISLLPQGKKELNEIREKTNLAYQDLLKQNGASQASANLWGELNKAQNIFLEKTRSLNKEQQAIAQHLMDQNRILTENAIKQEEIAKSAEKQSKIDTRSTVTRMMEKGKLNDGADRSQVVQATEQYRAAAQKQAMLSTVVSGSLGGLEYISEQKNVTKTSQEVVQLREQLSALKSYLEDTGSSFKQAFGKDTATALDDLEAALSETGFDMDKASDAAGKLVKGFDAMEQELGDARNQLAGMFKGGNAFVDKYLDDIYRTGEKAGIGMGEFANKVILAKQSMDNLPSALDAVSSKLTSFGTIMTNVASLTSGAASLFYALSNLVNVFEDDSLSGWQKFVSILTTVSSMTFGVTQTLSGLRNILDENTKATIANSIAKLFNIKVKEKNADASIKEAVADEVESKTTDRNTQKEIGELTQYKDKTGQIKYRRKNGSDASKKEIEAFTNFQKNKQTPEVASENTGKALSKLKAGGLVLAGIAIAAISIWAAVELWNKDLTNLREAEKQLEQATARAEESMSRYNTMKDNMSAYEDAKKGIDELTKGTLEFDEAVANANEKAMKLLDTYKNLSYEVDENGIIQIDKDSLKTAQAAEFRRMQAGRMEQTQANIRRLEAQNQFSITDFQRNSVNSNGFGSTEDNIWIGAGTGVGIGGGLAAAGLSGMAAGAATGSIAPGAGTIIGAIVGLAAGITGAVIDQRDSSREEESAIKQLVKAYESNEGNTTSIDELIDGLDGVGKDVKDALKENAAETKLLATQIAENNRLIALQQAENLKTYMQNSGKGNLLNNNYATEIAALAAEKAKENDEDVSDARTWYTFGIGHRFEDELGNVKHLSDAEVREAYIKGRYGDDATFDYDWLTGQIKGVKVNGQNVEGIDKDNKITFDEMRNFLADQSVLDDTSEYYQNILSTFQAAQQNILRNETFDVQEASDLTQRLAASAAGTDKNALLAMTEQEYQAVMDLLESDALGEYSDEIREITKAWDAKTAATLRSIEEDKKASEIWATGASQTGVSAKALEYFTENLIENNDALQGEKVAAAQASVTHAKFAKGIETLNKTLSDNADKIKLSNRGTFEYAEALAAVGEAVKEAFGIEVSSEFIETNLDKIRAVANGATEGLDELRWAMTKDYVANLTLKEDVRSDINALLDELKTADPNIEIGGHFDNSEIIKGLNEALVAGDITTDQLNQMFGAIGYTPNIEYETVTNNSVTRGRIHLGDEDSPISFGYANVVENETKIPYIVSDNAGTADKPRVTGHSVTKQNTGASLGSSLGTNVKGNLNKARKADTQSIKKLEDEKDRYRDINEELEDIERNLENIRKQKDRAFGKDKLKYLQEEKQALDQQINSQQKLIDKIKEVKAEQYGNVDEYGFSFDTATGRITNYDQVYDKMLAKYKAGIAQATNQEDDELREQWDQWWETFTSNTDKYSDTIDQLEEEKVKLDDLKIQQEDLDYEALEYTIEIKTQVNDWGLKTLERRLKNIEDDAFAAAEAIELMGQQAGKYESNFNINKQGIEDLLKYKGASDAQIQAFLSGDGNAISNLALNAKDFEMLDQYREGLNEALENMEEVFDSIFERMNEVFNAINEKFDKVNEKLEHAKAIVTSFGDIIDLVGATNLGISKKMVMDITDAALGLAQTQVAVATAQKDKNQEMLAEARKGLAEATTEKAKKEWQESIDYYEEQVRESEQQWLDSLSTALEMGVERREKAINQALEAFLMETMGYKTIDDLMKARDYSNENADLYVKQYEKAYQLSKLTRDINNKMNEIDNIGAKQKLLKLEERINKAKSAGVELSQYELDNLRREYDLELARIALEEAQNAKTQVRLARSAEGGMSYIYTADENKTAELSQKLEDAIYNTAKANDEWVRSIEDGMLQATQTFVEQLQVINTATYDSEAERVAAIDELNQWYQGQMEFYGQQMDTTLNNNEALYKDHISNMNVDYNQNNSNFKTMFDNMYKSGNDFYTNFKDITIANIGNALLGETDSLTSFVKTLIVKLGTVSEYNGTKPTGDGLYATLAQEQWSWESFVTKSFDAAGVPIGSFADNIEALNGNKQGDAAFELNKFRGLVKKYLGNGEDGVKKIIFDANEEIDTLQNNTDFNEARKAATTYGNKVAEAMEKAYKQLDNVNGALDTLITNWTNIDELPNNIDKTIHIKTTKTDDKVETPGGSEIPTGDDPKYDPQYNTVQRYVIGDRVNAYDKATGAKRTDYIVSGVEKQKDGMYKYQLKSSPVATKQDPVLWYASDLNDSSVKTLKPSMVLSPTHLQHSFEYYSKDGTKQGRIDIFEGDAITLTGYGLIKNKPFVRIKYDSLSNENDKTEAYIKPEVITEGQLPRNPYYDITDLAGFQNLNLLSAFNTGGYTGTWGPEGRLAMLHQKEIVLNAHDTENLLSVVDIVRQLATKLDFNALTMARGLGDLMATAMVNTGNQQLDQNVTITAEFPNATNREEIQAAFGDLVNLAAQYANRK